MRHATCVAPHRGWFSSAGGSNALTVYEINDPTPVTQVYEEIGCAEDPNPGPDGGRVRYIPGFMATLTTEETIGEHKECTKSRSEGS